MASSSYRHSETFGSLKRIEEGINQNLTSHQMLSSLDHLLWNAVSLIYHSCPDLVLNYVTKVVAQQTLKPATKFSCNERSSLPSTLFNLLVTKDAQYLAALKLNRGLLFGLIAHFLGIVNDYRAVHDMTVRVRPSKAVAVEHAARIATGANPAYNLYSVAREVEYWAEKSHWFKSLVVQKFVRMSLLRAQATYNELAHSLSLCDVSQVYLMYVSKAIDRCDSRQGVLTTFIQNWLKSAKAEAGAMAKENMHDSYEELLETGAIPDSVSPDVSYDDLQHISAIAKKVDKEGYARIALGIPEYVSSKHYLLLTHFIPQ